MFTNVQNWSKMFKTVQKCSIMFKWSKMARFIILMQKTRMGGMLLDSEMGLWGLNKENGFWVEGAFYCCENTKAGSQCRYCTKIAPSSPSSCFSPFSYLYLIGLSRPQAPFSTCITIFSFSSPPWLLVMTFDTCTLLSPCNLGPHRRATKTLYKFTTRCYEGPFLVGLPTAWVWAWLCTYSEIGGHLLQGGHPPTHHSLSLEMCYITSNMCLHFKAGSGSAKCFVQFSAESLLRHLGLCETPPSGIHIAPREQD